MNSAPDIPGHSVTSVIGAGGFATVYRGWQLAVGREVAVKVDNRVLFSERDRRRFFREVTAAGRLSGHPNVVDVYDAGTLRDGRPYLVMELCAGGSLNDELRRFGPMSAARTGRIGVRLADALAAAHAAGVLHRDIKPANILINRYGIVGLADFGLASIIAASGEQSVTRDALTPAYAPPESFHSEEPTATADIYSLAATLYALLAGRPPRFPANAGSPGSATILSLHDRPVEDVPGAPPELLALLRQYLATDPAARPATAVDLRDTLATLTARLTTHASPPEQASSLAQAISLALASSQEPRAGSQASSGSARASDLRFPALGLPAQSWPDPVPMAPRPAERLLRPPAHRRRPVALAALAGGLVLVIAAAMITGARLFWHGASSAGAARSSHGAGTGAAVGVFGIPTVTRGCPAASVQAAGARCPKVPECWNGPVEVSGNESASRLPCAGPHIWETFAIAILPADASTYDVNIVAADPTVRAVCSPAVLLRSRRGIARLIPPRSWEIDALPPDEAAFSSGARAYRCLAHVLTGPNPRTSEFSR